MFQMIVQALYNLTYIQALFTIVSDMSKTEQKQWSSVMINNKSENVYFHSCSLKTTNYDIVFFSTFVLEDYVNISSYDIVSITSN